MLSKSTLCFFLTQGQETRVYKLHNQIPTSYEASNSVILSLVNYLLNDYPQLPHPSYIQNAQLKQVSKSPNSSTQKFAWTNQMFQPWSDLLTNAVLNGNGFRREETLYMALSINADYQKYLQQTDMILQTRIGQFEIEELFGHSKTDVPYRRKIALPNFAGSQLRKNKLQPKIHIPALLLGLFYDNQKWEYYQILKGQIPTTQQIANYDAIILPGSTLSVLDRNQNVVKFMQNYAQATKINKSIRTLSICFGHQLVCDLYSAKVGKKQRKTGQEQVRFDKYTISQYSFLKPLITFEQNKCIMPEHHQDYVFTIPEGFDLVGESDSCQIQCVIKKDGSVMSMQFHPEYFTEYADIFSIRQQSFDGGHGHLLDFDFGKNPQILELHHDSCTQFRKCMKLFLGGQ